MLLALVVVLALVRWDSRSVEHRYALAPADAGRLLVGDAVRVGGRRVGPVEDLRLTADRGALVLLRVDDEIGPLHEGTTATVRAPALAGPTERYVALAPGPNNAPEIVEGGRLGADDVAGPADVDALLSGLDAPTRSGLRALLQDAPRSAAGRERRVNDALALLHPALRAGRATVGRVARDAPALEAFLEAGSRVVGALARERTTLPGLLRRARSVTAAVALEEDAVDATLRGLPAAVRRGSATLARADGALGALEPLVADAPAATRGSAALLRRLRPLATASGPVLLGGRRLLRLPGREDLTDLLQATPALADAAVPALQHTAQAAGSARPIARVARPYAPDLVGWLRGLSQTTAGYDAAGHYARVQPLVERRALSGDPVLGPPVRILGDALGLDADARAQDVGARRCPGTATQLRPDGSNDPRRGPERPDCDPDAVLPGP